MTRVAPWASWADFQLFQPACDLDGERALGVQDNDWKKRSNTSLPRSREKREIHSLSVWARAMSPGPKTTLGMPPCARTEASQKKWTPAGPVRPTLRRNCRTTGSPGLISRGRQGAALPLASVAGRCFLRSNELISRATATSVSPGKVRRSMVIVQRMAAPAQFCRIFSLEQIDNASHRMNGVASQLRAGAVSGPAARFQLKP